MYKPFKVGDEVVLKAAHKNEILVVEQTYLRGKVPHYLCSFKGRGWTPVFYNHNYIELAEPPK